MKGKSLMNWNKISKLFSLLLALSLITACSSTPPSTNETPSGSTTVKGICANDYYPVVQGATWTYKSTGSPAGDYSFTDTISSVKRDGFTLTSQYGNLTRTQDWNCTEQGLVALQLGGPAVATLHSQDMNFTFDAKKVEGVTIPPQMTPGNEWGHSLDFEGKMDIAGESATAEGNAQTAFKALGEESVNVPAGSFQAMKVEVNTNITFTIKVQGISVPASFSGSYTYWYAKGVGWVKAEGQGNITGTSFMETIELQKYNIP
jgi:hypothetical protein